MSEQNPEPEDQSPEQHSMPIPDSGGNEIRKALADALKSGHARPLSPPLEGNNPPPEPKPKS
jgi:hypothetical protein